jgi:pre-mRNA-splicing factor 18
MDALKAEIALKRKVVQSEAEIRPSKYMRRGELERLKEEEERQAREEKEKERAVKEVIERNAAAARSIQKQKVSLSCHLNLSSTSGIHVCLGLRTDQYFLSLHL